MKKDLEKFKIYKNQSIKDAIGLIRLNECRCIFVFEENDLIIGSFSEGDILSTLLKGININAPIEKFCNYSFSFLNNYDVVKAKELFKKKGIPLIPIIKNKKLIDIITISDVL